MATTTTSRTPAPPAAPVPRPASREAIPDRYGSSSAGSSRGSTGGGRAGAGGIPSRFSGALRGPATDPAWARPALLGLLAATAAFYLWNLTANGYANAFYSAAAQAGSESWKAFFYGSLDSSNAITVDKPPASLWLMALSVRILGLSSFAILLPQVLMGIGTVAIVHASVKRYWGAAAGLLAGAVMALTPVAVLMFRFNNPDALLVLLMALGAWATLRSIERGSARWMALVGVLIGLGFLTKALQVLLVVPFFGIAYLLAARTTPARRALGALAGVAAMVLSAGWWVAVVELVPESVRPYLGGSQTNSFLEVTFGYNGLGRLSGEETGSVGGGNGWGQTGLGRLFSASVGGQVSWLIPSALILLAAGVYLRGRAPRTDLRRAAYLVWGGWLVVTALTFSLMAGIFHEYYTVALAPAVAALVGMGAAEAWENRRRTVGAIALAAATAAAATWSFLLLARTSEYGTWLRFLVLTVGLAAALLLLAVDRLHASAVKLVAGAAVIAALAGPAAYSLTTVTTAHSGSIVTAGPATGTRGPGAAPGGPGGPGMPGGQLPAQARQGGATGPAGGMGGLLEATTPSTEVVAALSADASSYRWVAAAVGSQNAAGLQLGTGLPVMAIGGFNGSDPYPTLAQFQAYVAAGDIHYLLADSGRGGGPNGSATSAIVQWAAASYDKVTIGGTSFYDLTAPLTGGDQGSATSDASLA